MAKYKPVEQGQGLFITLYPDMQFEDHSLEKVINRFIDEEISMDIFDDAYANDRGGQTCDSSQIALEGRVLRLLPWRNLVKNNRKAHVMPCGVHILKRRENV